MSNLTRKIIAVIGLAAMPFFVVSLVFVLGFNEKLMYIMGPMALISGFVGIMSWFLIYIDNKKKKGEEELLKTIDSALKEGAEKEPEVIAEAEQTEETERDK